MPITLIKTQRRRKIRNKEEKTMTNIEKSTKLESLATNESFIEAMKEAENKDDIHRVFATHGLELNEEEMNEILKMISRMLNGEELSDIELESVSGGVSAATVFGWAWKGVKATYKYCIKAGKWLADNGY